MSNWENLDILIRFGCLGIGALLLLVLIAYLLRGGDATRITEVRNETHYHYNDYSQHTTNQGASAKEIAQIILLALEQGAQFKELRGGKVVAVFPDGSSEVLDAEEVRVLEKLQSLPPGR